MSKIYFSYQRMLAQLAARSCSDLEVTGSNPTIRWETFGLNPQTRSSRISRIPPKVGPDQPVVYTKKKKKKRLSNLHFQSKSTAINVMLFFNMKATLARTLVRNISLLCRA